MDECLHTNEAACPYCGVGCRLVVQSNGQAVTKIRGAQDATANRGRICPKGATLGQVIHTADRARVPLLREDRSQPFREASWEEMTAFVADRLQSIIRTSGPDAFGFYGSGQLDTETVYAIGKFVKGNLGTNNTDSNSRLCMASAVAGYRSSLGSDGPPTCYADIAGADVILILGSNMAEAHPVTFDFVKAKKRIQPSTFIIVVDPRRTRTAELADLHLQILPGSDVALLNALTHFLVTRELVDIDFIRKHTTGYTELAAYTAALDVEELAALCGVEPGDLLTAADRIGCARRFLSFYTMGANQSTSGVQKNNCIINLHLLTGQIGKAGAGPFSLTGQPNAMGGREAGLLCQSLPGYRLVENPEHRREMEQAWDLPPGSISEQPGLTAVEMFQSLAAGGMKAIWICGTNPMVSLPDLNAARQGLENAALVIAQDCYVPTDTTEMAHVVFPAAQWIEKEGTSTNSERTVTFSEKILDPPGEAKPDWQIICAVARAMGFTGFEWKDSGEVWEEYRPLTRDRVCDQYGITTARLRKVRSLQWPCPHETHPGTQRLYGDGVFPTPNGRARLLTRPYRDPAEAADDWYPLLLTTGRLSSHWHTRTRTRHVPMLERQEPEPFIEIHPEDAAARGIEDGVMMAVESRRGMLVAQARISPNVRKGLLFAAFHWSERFRQCSSVNAVTIAALDPISKEPEFKHCAVQAKPLHLLPDHLDSPSIESTLIDAPGFAEALFNLGLSS